jgi:hypothetical protein
MSAAAEKALEMYHNLIRGGNTQQQFRREKKRLDSHEYHLPSQFTAAAAATAALSSHGADDPNAHHLNVHLHHHHRFYYGKSEGKKPDSIRVQVPRRMMYYAIVVFLVLPILIFLWKEVHLKSTVEYQLEHPAWNDRRHHSHSDSASQKVFPSWMEDGSTSEVLESAASHSRHQLPRRRSKNQPKDETSHLRPIPDSHVINSKLDGRKPLHRLNTQRHPTLAEDEEWTRATGPGSRIASAAAFKLTSDSPNLLESHSALLRPPDRPMAERGHSDHARKHAKHVEELEWSGDTQGEEDEIESANELVGNLLTTENEDFPRVG